MLRELDTVLLVAALLAGRPATAGQPAPGKPAPHEPAAGELCAILAAPQQYADQRIKVRGDVVAGFELLALGSRACAGRLWLEMADEGSAAARVGSACRGRIVPDVSPAQFLEWGRSGLLKTPGALPWREVAPATPVERVRNQIWRRFLERATALRPLTADAVCLDCPRYAVSGTLLGVVEYQPAGCITQTPDGALLYQAGGFGPGNQYPTRLVVSEVLEFSAQPVAAAKP